MLKLSFEKTRNILKLLAIFSILGNSLYGAIDNNIAKTLSFLSHGNLSNIELDSAYERINYNKKAGFWIESSAGEIKSNKLNSSFKNKYNLTQVGVNTQNIFGKRREEQSIAIYNQKNKINFQNGKGVNENITLSLHHSFINNNGGYIDLGINSSYIVGKYNIKNDSSKIDIKYKTWAETLSLEHGKKYYSQTDNWYIIPHYQLNYTCVKGNNYKTNINSLVSQETIHSFVGKIGVYIGKTFEKSSHYIKIGGYSQVLNDSEVKIVRKNSLVKEKFNGDDTWIEIGIGGIFQIGKKGTTSIFYDVEKTIGRDFETNWQGNLGLKIQL